LSDLIEQDHPGVKPQICPLPGFKRLTIAAISVAGIELLLRIRKGRFDLNRLLVQNRRTPVHDDAVLPARSNDNIACRSRGLRLIMLFVREPDCAGA